MPMPYYLADPRPEIELIEVEPQATVVVKAQDYPMADLGQLFDIAFSAIFSTLPKFGIAPVGPPFSLYAQQPAETIDLEIGVPVSGQLPADEVVGELTLTNSALPGGRLAAVSYFGSFGGLGDAWGALMNGVDALGQEPAMPGFEVYVTEPTPDMNPDELRTDLYIGLA